MLEQECACARSHRRRRRLLPLPDAAHALVAAERRPARGGLLVLRQAPAAQGLLICRSCCCLDGAVVDAAAAAASAAAPLRAGRCACCVVQMAVEWRPLQRPAQLLQVSHPVLDGVRPRLFKLGAELQRGRLVGRDAHKGGRAARLSERVSKKRFVSDLRNWRMNGPVSR